MTKQKTIIRVGNFRLRQYDGRNWVLEEHRSANPTNPLTKSAEPKWRSRDRYFQSVAQGLSWMLEHEMLTDGGEHDLESAIKRMECISEYIAEAAASSTGSPAC